MRVALIDIPVVVIFCMALGAFTSAGVGRQASGLVLVLVAIWVGLLIAYLTRGRRDRVA